MPRYRVQEGSYEIPAHWQDNSINIHAVDGGDGTAAFSFVVNRERTQQGESLVDFAERQLAQIGEQLEDFTTVDKRQLAVDGATCLGTEFTWTSEQGPMHQQQIYIPCGDEMVLIFTATAQSQLTGEQREQVDRLLSSFTFHRP